VNATFDFDRDLRTVLAEGPTAVPGGLVEGALERARLVRQRRPLIPILIGVPGPPRRSAGNPMVARAALLAIVALLLVAFVAGLAAVGARCSNA
jgi:hypothetical protein